MENFDWKKIIALRDLFLKDRITTDYWSDDESLALYDHFFAARIGWKWQSVWSDLKSRSFLKQSSDIHVIDWGCGTGIATRVTLDALGVGRVANVTFVDRSTRALKFASARLLEESEKTEHFKTPAIHCVSNLEILPATGTRLLLISHVLNELKPKQEDALVRLAQTADACIWVEPGALHQSLRLSQCRNALTSAHSIAAPCTHQTACPMVGQNDWCHHFAAVPNSIFRDAAWAHFAKNIGVDLHRLPYSFVASTKPALATLRTTEENRVVGQTRYYKGYAKAQFCGPKGLHVAQVNERKQFELFAGLKSGAAYFDSENLF